MATLLYSGRQKASAGDERRSLDSSRAAGPVFVVGLWRSGTSLLYALLNQHPQVALLYEGELPVLSGLFLGGRAKSDWLERWEFWNQAPSRHGLQVKSIPPGLDLCAATEAVCREYARHKHAAVWGCKSPAYHDELPFLAKTFPTARIIVIWRDLTSICDSIVRAGARSRYFSRPGILRRALFGYRQLKLGCEWLLRAGVPLHQLHYEDLVSNPETEIRSICNFLQVSFDPRMLALGSADRSAIYPDEHHTLVRRENIVSPENRQDVLSPRIKAEIIRYIYLWKTETRGEWPRYPRSLPSDVRTPSRLQRFFDRSIYWLLRSYDSFKMFLYSFVPLRLLKTYRELRSHRRIGRRDKGRALESQN